MKKIVVLLCLCLLAFCSCGKCKHDDPTQIVVVDAVAPTCQKTGLTEGMLCNLCGTMVVPQATVETVEHVRNDWIIDIEPTETANGKRHYECIACGGIIHEEFNIEVGNQVGNRCPTYSLELIDGSGNINVKDLKGKIVIVHFWGMWAPKNRLSDLNRVAEEYDGEVVVLAVHSTSSAGKASSYITENFPGSKMLFAYDIPLNENIDLYYDLLGGRSMYPATLILDENGIIMYTLEGQQEYSTLVSLIEEIKNK